MNEGWREKEIEQLLKEAFEAVDCTTIVSTKSLELYSIAHSLLAIAKMMKWKEQ